MTGREVRRYRGIIDDFIGGALTFLLELGVVLGFALVALVAAAVVLALV